MTVKGYLLSFPERFARSVLGLGAGAARELGEVALPEGIRRSQLYQNLVDATLRYLIEQVGGVEGVYRAEEQLPDNFLVRRAAGNAVEVYLTYAGRQFRPYMRAAVEQFSPKQRSLTERLLEKLQRNRG